MCNVQASNAFVCVSGDTCALRKRRHSPFWKNHQNSLEHCAYFYNAAGPPGGCEGRCFPRWKRKSGPLLAPQSSLLINNWQL